MDNRIFSVNGSGKEMLAQAIALAFSQESSQKTPCEGWSLHPKKGLLLLWHAERQDNKFLSKLDATACAEQVWAWLQTVEPEHFELGDWQGDLDHDGSNSKGWLVYVEDWGHVAGNNYVLAAIKPVYLWHGK